MLPIYICEDNEMCRKKLGNSIRNHIQLNSFNMEIICSTDSPGVLLDRLKARRGESLYFLDLNLGRTMEDGYMLADQIRKMDPDGHIVIVTTYEGLSPLSFEYRIEAMDYIVKDRDRMDKRILCCLEKADRICSGKQFTELSVCLETDTGNIKIPVRQMLYLRTVEKGRIRIVKENNGKTDTSMTLDAAQEQLPPDQFFRCHRSYIANMGHIINIDGSSALFDNGASIPVARRHREYMQKRLSERMEKGNGYNTVYAPGNGGYGIISSGIRRNAADSNKLVVPAEAGGKKPQREGKISE